MSCYGIIQMFYSSSLPSGWLKLNGSWFDDEEYPALYDLLGSNYLPDMRERFPRCRTAQSVGSVQADCFGSHTHIQDAHTHVQNQHTHIFGSTPGSGSVVNVVVNGGSGVASYENKVGYATATNQNTTATNQNAGGTETRPKSMYLQFAIYAKEGYPMEEKIDQILEICQKFDKSYSANEDEFHLSDELLNLCQTWFWTGQSRGG